MRIYGEDGTHPIHEEDNFTVPNFPHAEDGTPDTEKKELTKMSTSISRKCDDELLICVEEAVSLNVANSPSEKTCRDSSTKFLPDIPHEPTCDEH